MALALPEWLGRAKPGSDVALALGVTGLLAVLVVPLPPLLLDFGLSISITAAVLVLFGATLRTDDPTGALAALARVSDPKIRRDRLDTMVFALKDFGPADPASLAWLDRLLGAAEIQADPAFRAEALTALCRVAYRAATALAQRPEVQDKAAAMAEIAARRRHAPSAQVLALLTEMKGGAPARGEAARWTAIAAAGFDATERSRAEAMAALATFTAGERADAARLLGASGDASPQRLAALARR